MSGGRIECGVPRERKWGGDQAEQEKLNGEWLCIGRAGSPGFRPQAPLTQEEARNWQEARQLVKELGSTIY